MIVNGNQCFFLLVNFLIENMILTYAKDFSWKEKDLNSPDFEKLFFESPDFYDKFQQIVKNIEPFCYFLL